MMNLHIEKSFVRDTRLPGRSIDSAAFAAPLRTTVVLFKLKGHIWRINADGSGSVQLTNGTTGESSPRWSPDGTRIAFVANRDESDHNQVYLLNNMGGEAWALTDHATSMTSRSPNKFS